MDCFPAAVGRVQKPSLSRHQAMRRIAGFSILELLLAAALGLVVTVALTQLFAASSRSHATLVGQARLQEAARHAFEFIGRSARSAGYLGCGTGREPASVLNGAGRRLAEFDVAVPVVGFEGIGDNAAADQWQPSLAALPVRGGALAVRTRTRIDIAKIRPLSDVVVFRRSGTGFPLVRRLAGDSDPLVVADAEGTLEGGDVVVLTDCRRAVVFRATSVAGNDEVTLAKVAGLQAPDNRAGASLLGGGNAFGGFRSPRGAMVGRVVTEIYFVARSAADNNRGQPAWSLWRRTATDRAVELVQGIDDLQLLFGIDTQPDDGVDTPERYVRADAVGGSRVRTLHVAVTASSVDALPPGDRPLRRTFSRTVALRNK